jgi:DNA-directed RNA polymerase I subunit RPA1
MSNEDQVRGMFAVYGTAVDPRHLFLIADFMTYDGEYKPMIQIEMADISFTFLQMSSKSTSAFMVDAAFHKRNDPMMSPSANIVMGNLSVMAQVLLSVLQKHDKIEHIK